jgi:glycosyltransferase involved in cell wall biosynthesis
MSTSAELISVIVTNYNHAKYLDERMDSLLKQTYPNLEIIVIDNCSTDNSLEVLAKYKKYNHVKIVALEKNGGCLNSCNMGVRMSQGRFFIFSEADDYCAPQQIELLYKTMKDNEEVGVSFCRSYMVDAQSKVYGDDFSLRDSAFKKYCSKDTVIPRRLAQRLFLFSCFIPNFSAVLFRKKVFELAGGFPPQISSVADWEFWFRFSPYCDFYYLTTPLNYYRRHGTSHQGMQGAELLITDMMDLLYTEYRKAQLTLWEKFEFKVNIGVIWGRYRKPAPKIWWKSFPAIWRHSCKYDKLSIVYLILAFIIKSTQRVFGKICLKGNQ